MSHNHNFNKSHGSNFTFRYVPDFPPPPLPPPVLPLLGPPFIHPQHTTVETVEKEDETFIKQFESQIPEVTKKYKSKATTITQIREELKDLLTELKDFEIQLNSLTENIEKFPDDKWKKCMEEMEAKRKNITNKLEECVGSHMDMSRRLLAKRTAKRLRLKRLKEEKKIIKKERIKQREERSRKIDENLQKIKDDILKAQKVEEAKLEADEVLREVRRQKQDAKKCLVKLDALLKLRKARQNTVKGRGETVSEKETTTFINNVEKLKTLWSQKLLLYEKEEIELNARLAEQAVETEAGLEGGVVVEANLLKWREVLFGDSNTSPQVDFHGDIHRFIAVRSQWDQYLNKDGTPLPVGWVVPILEA